jgi:hypothetical protein
MSTTTRWTSADLESLPDDGNRYEIIDGELYMSKQPHFYHQDVCGELQGEPVLPGFSCPVSALFARIPIETS